MTRIACFAFVLMWFAFAGDDALPAALELVPKPPDAAPERRARQQADVPENYTEVPFVETAEPPELTAAEEARGYMLFTRPITEPVHPNTRPLAHERLAGLSAFATPGEYEPVTFGVYPVRDLENFKVRVSALSGPSGEIPACDITVRLLTYWNMGFPSYTSRDTYRRVGELLEPVNVHSSPAGECQRWWIRIHVPDNAAAGLYRGKVTLWDDGLDKAIEIPLSLRVLGFPLASDPAKHYSSYYYPRNGVVFRGKDEDFIRNATGNDYKAMAEYGLDMIPTFTFRVADDGESISLRYAEEMDRMLAAGLSGPVPVTADSAIARIYRDTTPGGRRESHWIISKEPGPEFYEKVTALFAAFEKERKAKGWPEFVCCPVDEVSAAHKDFGAAVYKAVKDAGMRTYATKNPRAADAAVYRPYIDIWCSQPYSVPYGEIVSQDRYEYWCYPNHNAGEIKDRRVMCKGGRMTYGFGFWKSGYTTLIPWNWNWTPDPDQFDYLRGSRSGCGQRIGDDGEVIPAVYWECFREGRDDARYIYTLQQAVWEREGSDDADCRRLVDEGKALLQEMWDAINVQEKYLAEGMWASEEFDARRWRLAMAVEALREFPAVREGNAPSVLVADTAPKADEGTGLIVEKALEEGTAELLDLGADFSEWKSGTKEGSTEVTEAAGIDGREGLRWRVNVDFELDGEGNQYPVGWPFLHRDFPQGELDMTKYDYLEFMVRVDSDRDEVADDSTRLGLVVTSHEGAERVFIENRDLGGNQRVWIPFRFGVADMMASGGKAESLWQAISRVHLWIAERDYPDGSKMVFDIGSARLVGFKSPAVSRIDAARVVTLPAARLAVPFEVVGERSVTKGSHTVTASVIDAAGGVCAEAEEDLSRGTLLVLDASGLSPGAHRLEVKITSADGVLCSEAAAGLVCVAGPTSGN